MPYNVCDSLNLIVKSFSFSDSIYINQTLISYLFYVNTTLNLLILKYCFYFSWIFCILQFFTAWDCFCVNLFIVTIVMISKHRITCTMYSSIHDLYRHKLNHRGENNLNVNKTSDLSIIFRIFNSFNVGVHINEHKFGQIFRITLEIITGTRFYITLRTPTL